jgi:hypothetical protein
MSDDIRGCISLFFKRLEITYSELNTEINNNIVVTKIQTEES